MTLREIQLFSLEILKDVHTFCVENGIRYSLCGGTLIGAVRHRGFIPWDDDIDINMPRPDYERFCNTYRSSRFHIVAPDDPVSCISFARVCDMKVTFVDCHMEPWCYTETGIWIDIFPMDGASDTYLEYLKDARSAVFWHKIQYRCRCSHARLKRGLNLRQLFRLLVLKIIFLPGTRANAVLNKHANGRIKTIATKYAFSSMSHWTQIVCPIYYKNEYHSITGYENFVLIDFEGEHLMVFANYEDYLRDIFGDFMVLPPEPERIPKQNNMLFYWR